MPRRPAAAAQVLWATDPVELAVGASHAIFVSSPVAVLVSAGASSSSVAAAATRAIALGAPLLLAPDSRSRDGDTDLRRELARLGTHWILATDEAARRSAKPLPGEHVVTEAASLPALGLRHTADRLTMLVDSATATATGTGTGRAMPNGVAAARATAAAAGARIVPMDGSDPRTDPATIAALARHPPRHVIAVGPHTGSASRVAARVATAATGIQLPGGGQVMFPYRRLVALYGNPYDRNLGVLGHQGLHKAIARAKKVAGQYRSLSSVPVVPAFEIIATVATAAPGPDGDYSAESTVADLKPWVTAAGDAGLYVILDLQPGRAHLLDQAKRYRSLLELPYVGLALDPEWKLGPGQRPLQQIGSVDAAEVNQVIGWLGALTAAHHLPQKVLVLHQFRLSMLRDESAIDTGDDDVALVIHMDGQGAPHVKDATWRAVVAAAPKGAYFGWKDFYTKDTPMLSPRQTMAHTPTPLMISYQ